MTRNYYLPRCSTVWHCEACGAHGQECRHAHRPSRAHHHTAPHVQETIQCRYGEIFHDRAGKYTFWVHLISYVLVHYVTFSLLQVRMYAFDGVCSFSPWALFYARNFSCLDQLSSRSPHNWSLLLARPFQLSLYLFIFVTHLSCVHFNLLSSTYNLWFMHSNPSSG